MIVSSTSCSISTVIKMATTSFWLPSISLHLLFTISSLHTAYSILTNPTNPSVRNKFGSHFQYLTNIAFLLSFLTSTVAIGHSAFVKLGFIGLALDRLHRTLRFLAAPLEVVIATCYWPLYLVNPGLLAEKRALPPLYIDAGLHLLPAVFLVLDYTLLPPLCELRLDSRVSMVFLAFLMTGYAAWLSECRRRNGTWAYPVLEKLTYKAHIVLLFGTIGAVWWAREVLISKEFTGIETGCSREQAFVR